MPSVVNNPLTVADLVKSSPHPLERDGPNLVAAEYRLIPDDRDRHGSITRYYTGRRRVDGPDQILSAARRFQVLQVLCGR